MSGNLGNIRNVENGYLSEITEILKLTSVLVIRKLNVQYALYFAALMAFGFGDGFTGAYMMKELGIGIESNPVARHMFITYGFGGVVAAKLWFTMALLFITYIIQLKSSEKMYWTINGFLIALTAGGLMAINANLTAIAGNIPQAPSEIIFIYLSMVLILTEMGSLVDRWTEKSTVVSYGG